MGSACLFRYVTRGACHDRTEEGLLGWVGQDRPQVTREGRDQFGVLAEGPAQRLLHVGDDIVKVEDLRVDLRRADQGQRRHVRFAARSAASVICPRSRRTDFRRSGESGPDGAASSAETKDA